MTYTTQADIEAMAHVLWNNDNPDLVGYGVMPCEQPSLEPYRVLAKKLIAASPVHAELARVKAENEGLREALEHINSMFRPIFTGGVYPQIRAAVKQALQTKGGE